jgi:hypothetical protein
VSKIKNKNTKDKFPLRLVCNGTETIAHFKKYSDAAICRHAMKLDFPDCSFMVREK